MLTKIGMQTQWRMVSGADFLRNKVSVLGGIEVTGVWNVQSVAILVVHAMVMVVEGRWWWQWWLMLLTSRRLMMMMLLLLMMMVVMTVMVV